MDLNLPDFPDYEPLTQERINMFTRFYRQPPRQQLSPQQFSPQLPPQVYQEILLQSDYPTVRRMCTLDKRVNSVCNSSNFWFQKYSRDFPNSIPFSNTQPPETWRDKYKYRYAHQNEGPGFEVKIDGVSYVIIKTNTEDDVWKYLANVYNDDTLPSSQLKNKLIEHVNEKILIHNRHVFDSNINQIRNQIDDFIRTPICSISTDDSDYQHNIRKILSDYYLTPELLLNHYTHDMYAKSNEICVIYEIVLFFEKLYIQGFLKYKMAQPPNFDKLKDYYSKFKLHDLPSNRVYRSFLSVSTSSTKYLPTITASFLKTKIGKRYPNYYYQIEINPHITVVVIH